MLTCLLCDSFCFDWAGVRGAEIPGLARAPLSRGGGSVARLLRTSGGSVLAVLRASGEPQTASSCSGSFMMSFSTLFKLLPRPCLSFLFLCSVRPLPLLQNLCRCPPCWDRESVSRGGGGVLPLPRPCPHEWGDNILGPGALSSPRGERIQDVCDCLILHRVPCSPPPLSQSQLWGAALGTAAEDGSGGKGTACLPRGSPVPLTLGISLHCSGATAETQECGERCSVAFNSGKMLKTTSQPKRGRCEPSTLLSSS